MRSTNDTIDLQTTEWYRERGKFLLRSSDAKQREEGIRCLQRACRRGDFESEVLVADLMLRGVIQSASGETEEEALRMLRRQARKGNVQARTMLNAYCAKQYEQAIGAVLPAKTDGPLVDFSGKRIRINRTGIMTPVDAKLEYQNGVNRLTFSVNLRFFQTEKLAHPDAFKQAVLDGIRLWQGEYRVFGNQKLQVIVQVSAKKRLWDSVLVCPMTDDLNDRIVKLTDTAGVKSLKDWVHSTIVPRRSFAMSVFWWSSISRKLILILSKDGKFEDYEDIKHVVKHEFGHVLGLGDLYESSSDALSGVEKGTYAELDGYYLTNKIYNLVMCDHFGPISNNDMEMVVLAFRRNKEQLYQNGKWGGELSQALGRGN